jgi:hypothetical protein
MIEITVRDGRAGRDQTKDSAEGGAILATLQRDRPYDIGDVIGLTDGNAVVVIGENEEIQPGASWKQTVFVGELDKPRPQVRINLGACLEWTLQSGVATPAFVRCVSEGEAKQIMASANFCRKYATMPTHRLLSSSFRIWRQTFDRVANAKSREWQPAFLEDLLGAFVGWILIWRLVFDQAEHDLSSRFGDNSDQLAEFRLARKLAYDASRGYRVVEALRNLVQHRGVPSLQLSRAEQLNRATGQVMAQVSYKFTVSDLINDPKCPATIKKEFRENPEMELEVPDLIDDAMAALNPVLLELTRISTPELIGHIPTLRRIFVEASGTPTLLRLKPPPADGAPVGVNFDMVALADLQFLVQNLPIPEATTSV